MKFRSHITPCSSILCGVVWFEVENYTVASLAKLRPICLPDTAFPTCPPARLTCPPACPISVCPVCPPARPTCLPNTCLLDLLSRRRTFLPDSDLSPRRRTGTQEPEIDFWCSGGLKKLFADEHRSHSNEKTLCI